MEEHLVLKKRKMQIDSDDSSPSDSQKPEKSDKIQLSNGAAAVPHHRLHKKEEKNLQKSEKLAEKQEKSLQERLETLQKEKKSPKISEMDQIIDHLFEPDHSDSWSEINKIKEEIQEEKKEKLLREQKRRERKQREREERQEREQEKEKKKKNNSTIRVADGPGLSKRDELIYDVLIRWWYCLPEWPPKDYDFQQKLNKLQLKAYEYKNFRNAKDIDQNGFKKVYHIEGYEGCYKDKDGQFIDLRPVEGKPSYSEFKKKSDAELKELLKKALEVQIQQLEEYLKESDDLDTTYLESLKKKLKRLS